MYIFLWLWRGALTFLDEENILLEFLAIKIVTTVMLNEIVHVKCLAQCLVYGRLLVNQQCLFTLFKSYCFFLSSPLPSPLLPFTFIFPSSFYFSSPSSSPNYLPCLLQYTYFFICSYRIINESRVLKGPTLNYFQCCINLVKHYILLWIFISTLGFFSFVFLFLVQLIWTEIKRPQIP